ncbi:unnamed protein product [Paramecium octaurelia]|uniref:Uncharacterized protein n=1 Tax=Paramecium octaurelia TaxID=43137 RepID=A0A8S1T6I9_PAROT|nr:unnamed protein product [Paramecium octaurelia]
MKIRILTVEHIMISITRMENGQNQEKFLSNSYIPHGDEYKINKKIDKWDINYRFSSIYQFEWIVGGSYNQDGIKNVLWIDLIGNFYRQRQVMFKGEYQNNQNGGGSYDKTGIKKGKWIELSNKFQIIYQGMYQNGKKVDKRISILGSLINLKNQLIMMSRELKLDCNQKLAQVFQVFKSIIFSSFQFKLSYISRICVIVRSLLEIKQVNLILLSQ